MRSQQAKLLLQKYVSGNCTEAEKALLETWFFKENIDGFEELAKNERLADLNEVSTLLNLEQNKTPKTLSLWPRIAAAAVLILTLGIATYYFLQHDADKVQTASTKVIQDVKPGGNRAVLTLANGKKINLQDAKEGALAQESGIVITKTAAGELVYTVVKDVSKNAQSASLNKIETPKGGQYQIDLPDGTKVWLNAASSLKFPTLFSGNTRVVELSGEAYFEVAKDKTKPFKVISDKQTVEVLGTHFNINGYSDELNTKTTLLEGSVKVTDHSKQTLILKPGDQSTLNSKNFERQSVDVDEAVAWKNGQFIFTNESLDVIMRKIARWYNVDIVFEKGLDDPTFTGAVSRYKNVSEVLATLELTNSVHFKIKDRTITVAK